MASAMAAATAMARSRRWRRRRARSARGRSCRQPESARRGRRGRSRTDPSRRRCGGSCPLSGLRGWWRRLPRARSRTPPDLPRGARSSFPTASRDAQTMLAAMSWSAVETAPSAPWRWSRTMAPAPPRVRSVSSWRTRDAWRAPAPGSCPARAAGTAPRSSRGRRRDLTRPAAIVQHGFDEGGLHLDHLVGELVPARDRADDGVRAAARSRCSSRTWFPNTPGSAL